MATYSSTLAWKILWTEKPGRLQSMGSQPLPTYKVSGELILNLQNVYTHGTYYIEDIEREAVTLCVPLTVHYQKMTYKMSIKLLKLKKISKIN